MREVRFSVDMMPIGKARPRSSGGRFYTPKKTQEAERVLGYAARVAMAGHAPIAGAVALYMHAVIPMPKSWSRRKREAHSGRLHTSAPDLDNIVKLVCDGALNGIVINDDRQIAQFDGCRKTWGEIGRIAVTVMEV